MKKVLLFLFVLTAFNAAHGQVHAETIKVYALDSDGSVGNTDSDWDVMQSAVVGSDAYFDGVDTNRAFVFINNGEYRALRSLMAFDTSVLPEDAEIISAKLGLYVNTTHNSDNDIYAYVNVYEGLQASVTSLEPGDFSRCGDSVTSPTPGANPVDIDVISTNQFLEFQLNTSGLSWVNENGYTKLCVREGHDVEDQAIDGTTFDYSGIRWDSVEKSVGTTTIAYLEIEYSLPEENKREGLYTQIESPYPSESQTASWAEEDYAGGGDYWCGSTIADCGCAITSLIMAGRDAGITTDVLGNDVNPLNLNEYLEAIGGYWSNGSLVWLAGQAYFSELTTDGLFSRLDWDKIYSSNVAGTLDDTLSNGEHVVLGFAEDQGHFVWLAGKTDESYEVYDPFWYETAVANELKKTSTVQTYDNTFESIRVYDVLAEPQRVESGVEAYLSGTAELLFESATGERVGFADGTTVIDLERSSYGKNGIISLTDKVEEDGKHLLVQNTGDIFTLTVIGNEVGEYTLELFTINEDGEIQTFEFTGKTFPGITTTFEFDLSTGEVSEQPISLSDLQLVIDELLADATKQQRAFFERWLEKVFADLENKTLTQALQTISTFRKLFIAKKVYTNKVELFIDALLAEE